MIMRFCLKKKTLNSVSIKVHNDVLEQIFKKKFLQSTAMAPMLPQLADMC